MTIKMSTKAIARIALERSSLPIDGPIVELLVSVNTPSIREPPVNSIEKLGFQRKVRSRAPSISAPITPRKKFLCLITYICLRIYCSHEALGDKYGRDNGCAYAEI